VVAVAERREQAEHRRDEPLDAEDLDASTTTEREKAPPP
jgi:hypothetical protein